MVLVNGRGRHAFMYSFNQDQGVANPTQSNHHTHKHTNVSPEILNLLKNSLAVKKGAALFKMASGKKVGALLMIFIA